MKKRLYIILTLITIILTTLLFTSCGNKNSFKIELIYRNGQPNETVTVPKNWCYNTKRGVNKNFPDNPIKDGWIFDGWYFDEACTQSVNFKFIDNDTKFYANWVDRITIDSSFTDPYIRECFSISLTAQWIGSPSNMVQITGSISALYDFTSDLSPDEIEAIINFCWVDGESFVGTYIDEYKIVANVSKRIYLKKENNFSISDLSFIEQASTYNTDPVLINTQTKSEISYMFGNPTLYINHD